MYICSTITVHSPEVGAKVRAGKLDITLAQPAGWMYTHMHIGTPVLGTDLYTTSQGAQL